MKADVLKHVVGYEQTFFIYFIYFFDALTPRGVPRRLAGIGVYFTLSAEMAGPVKSFVSFDPPE